MGYSMIYRRLKIYRGWLVEQSRQGLVSQNDLKCRSEMNEMQRARQQILRQVRNTEILRIVRSIIAIDGGFSATMTSSPPYIADGMLHAASEIWVGARSPGVAVRKVLWDSFDAWRKQWY